MNTHVLRARTRKGTLIELGHVASLEAAVRLQHALACVDPMASFTIEERAEHTAFHHSVEDAFLRSRLTSEPTRATVRSISYAEARRQLQR